MSLAHPQPIEVLSEDAGIEEAAVVSDISVPVEVAVPVEDISIEQESKFKVGEQISMFGQRESMQCYPVMQRKSGSYQNLFQFKKLVCTNTIFFNY